MKNKKPPFEITNTIITYTGNDSETVIGSVYFRYIYSDFRRLHFEKI